MGSIVRKRGGLWSVAFLMAWVCSVAALRDAGAADNTPEAAPFRVRVPNNEVAQAVTRALAGADRLLAEPACQEVLTDFRDASARTLKEILDGNDVSARGYLRWIVFSDGRGLKACGSKASLAVTEPGSRVVFICPTAFVETASGNPEYAEATLIHEMLHSLGLGENPPRSRDITERVRIRCAAPAEAGLRRGTSIGAPAESQTAIKRALALLPRRPQQIGVVDAEQETRPDVRERLSHVDAFVSKGRPVVYLTRHSEVLKGAQAGSSIHLYMLAAIIWHEMAHLDGADESEAQRREEGLWKRFVVEGRVDRVAALRYLKLMDERHRDR